MIENLSKPVMLLAGMGSLDSFGMRLSSLRDDREGKNASIGGAVPRWFVEQRA